MGFTVDADKIIHDFAVSIQNKEKEIMEMLRLELQNKTDDELFNMEHNAKNENRRSLLKLVREELNRRGY